MDHKTRDSGMQSYEDLEAEAARMQIDRTPQKRAFIEFTRTKKIETQLTRIANALEQLLVEAYSYNTDAPTTDASGPEPQVMYTDHDEHDIQDILDEVKERE